MELLLVRHDEYKHPAAAAKDFVTIDKPKSTCLTTHMDAKRQLALASVDSQYCLSHAISNPNVQVFFEKKTEGGLEFAARYSAHEPNTQSILPSILHNVLFTPSTS